MLDNVCRLAGLVTATALALTGAACGGDTGEGTADGTAVWREPSATATPRKPTRLKEITSACELLPVDVVLKVLGGTDDTELTSKEEPVGDSDTQPEYTCLYGRDGNDMLAFKASVLPDRADTVTETIDAIAEASNVATTRLEEPGADGVTYVTDGFRIVATVVPYEEELRLVVLSVPKIVPQAKVVELATHVVKQI